MAPPARLPGPAGPPTSPAGGAEPLAARRFRANPLYELVLFDRLTAAERRALARLREQPGFYGVLRPRGAAAGLSAKAVDRDTALLLLTLREPGPLPGYLAEVLGAELARTVARLVADGALEVERDGGFAAGPAALDLLPAEGAAAAHGAVAGSAAVQGAAVGAAGVQGAAAPAADVQGAAASAAASGFLAGLSAAALRWASRLPIDGAHSASPAGSPGPADSPEPAGVLAARLYAYNRRPLTPRWARRLPGREAVASWLGIAAGGGAAAAALARHWEPLPAREIWLQWRLRDAGSRAGWNAPFKLYLSPAPEALPEVFAAALGPLAAAGAVQLKVGADAAGVLRPDKLVAYLPDFERLAAAAEALAGPLAGAAVHGVPFTAEIGGGGLLSWGAEPPASRRLPGWRESWRLWLVNRLGRALLDARAAGEAEPWRFALERLRLDGVNTETWAPGARFWMES